MIIIMLLMVLLDHLDSTFAIQCPFRANADGLERERRTLAKLLIIINHQHGKIREDQLLLLLSRALKVKGHHKL